MNSKLLKTLLFAAATLAGANSAHAASFVFTPGGGGFGPNETNYADFSTTFGNQSNLTGSSGGYNTGVFAASVSGIAAQPGTGGPAPFFAVLGGGTATFTFDQAVGTFGFDFGSADQYNSLTLHFVDGTSQFFTGDTLNDAFVADGNQSFIGTNGRLTFLSFGNRITSVDLGSDQNSFEIDNIGIGAVPEPSAWALFILGFGMIGAGMRRRTAKATAIRAAFV
jgi:hypothetical protein